MIKLKDLNRQVNIWRGNTPPPTNYHVWLDDKDLKVFDDEANEWVLINANGTTDGSEIVIRDEVIQIIDEKLGSITINGKELTGNVEIQASDIKYESTNVKEAIASLYNTYKYD